MGRGRGGGRVTARPIAQQSPGLPSEYMLPLPVTIDYILSSLLPITVAITTVTYTITRTIAAAAATAAAAITPAPAPVPNPAPAPAPAPAYNIMNLSEVGVV